MYAHKVCSFNVKFKYNIRKNQTQLFLAFPKWDTKGKPAWNKRLRYPIWRVLSHRLLIFLGKSFLMFIHFERYAYISTRVESLSGPQKRLKRKELLRMSRGFKVSFWIRLDEWVVKSNAGAIIRKRRSLEIYF